MPRASELLGKLLADLAMEQRALGATMLFPLCAAWTTHRCPASDAQARRQDSALNPFQRAFAAKTLSSSSLLRAHSFLLRERFREAPHWSLLVSAMHPTNPLCRTRVEERRGRGG